MFDHKHHQANRRHINAIIRRFGANNNAPLRGHKCRKVQTSFFSPNLPMNYPSLSLTQLTQPVSDLFRHCRAGSENHGPTIVRPDVPAQLLVQCRGAVVTVVWVIWDGSVGYVEPIRYTVSDHSERRGPVSPVF